LGSEKYPEKVLRPCKMDKDIPKQKLTNDQQLNVDYTFRPDWVNESLYPFKSRYIELAESQVHYIDEGSGPVLLFLHSIPTWSFIYRSMIKNLQDNFRCIALDYPGFGLSKASDGFKHTLKEHSEIVRLFIQALELNGITMMVHDIGGPIGLGVAGKRPELFRALIIADTFGWPLKDYNYPKLERMVKLMATPFGSLIVDTNLLLHSFLKGIKRRSFSQEEKAAYQGPLAKLSKRHPMHNLFRSIVRSDSYLAEVKQGLIHLKDHPVLLIYGDKDPTFDAGFMNRFEQIFSRSHSVVLKGAGHFTPEEAPDEIISAIRSWQNEVDLIV
jgi:haloalkane dehalogenase